MFFPYHKSDAFFDQITKLMDVLSESPCHIPYVFVNHIQRSVPWKQNIWLDVAYDFYSIYSLSDKQIANIFEDGSFVKDSRVEQTVLFVQHFIEMYTDENIVKALEGFDSKHNQNVIFIYNDYYYQPIGNIPPHRLVPKWANNPIEGLRNLIDLVKNPNYDRFNSLKHVKLEDKRLNCLKNKTVHIRSSFTPSLFENIALLVYNSKEMLTTTIKYYPIKFTIIEYQFFQEYELNKVNHFKIFDTKMFGTLTDELSKSLTPINEDAVYVIQDPNKYTVQLCKILTMKKNVMMSFVFFW